MAHEYAMNTNEIPPIASTTILKRGFVLLCGLVGYLSGLVALLWFILALAFSKTTIGEI